MPTVLATLTALMTIILPTAAAGATGTTTTPPSGAIRVPAIASVPTYWLVASDGGVFAFGGSPFYGSAGALRLNQPVVGIAATSPSDFGGYREVAADGGIFSYGDAHFYGSAGNLVLNRPVVGMAPTPDGGGYWLVASDGGIFAYGDAHFYGSAGNLVLNQPVVGMAPTPDGGGYWLVAADGGVFAYGDAGYFGSTGNLQLVSPITSISATASGHGYLMVAGDGGIFAFGDAQYNGSMAGSFATAPQVAMTLTPSGGGYWMASSKGVVTAFGNATYWGSTTPYLAAPIVGMAEAPGTGVFTGGTYPSGSFGYDISNWQCGAFPPPPHIVSVVQVVGASFYATNACLGQEAAWAGGGLNLYAYLTFGEMGGSVAQCAGTAVPAACNYGFNAGIDAFNKAVGAGVNAAVPWWLDVEAASGWSTDQQANASLVQGALAALHAEGVAFVGIYASPLVWPQIVGNYTPGVPYWAAAYTPPPASTCVNAHTWWPGLPTGPLVMVQYGVGTINGHPYDLDYTC